MHIKMTYQFIHVIKYMTYRRWTKYSNLEEKIRLTPRSPNVNVKQRVRHMSCCWVWFLLSTRLNPWKKKTPLKLGGAGDKVVQGLNILSIYWIVDVIHLITCTNVWCFCSLLYMSINECIDIYIYVYTYISCFIMIHNNIVYCVLQI